MLYFEIYGKMGFWLGTLLSTFLILLGAAIYYSVRHYKKPLGEDGKPDEHAEPGIPLVLKGLYVGMAIYIIVATFLVAKLGIRI